MTDSSPLDVDVLVVGGGPAGSACAIRLASLGVRVAIIEASDFTRLRIGETIEPSAGPKLRQLGVDPDRQSWSCPCSGVASAWGTPQASHRPPMVNPYGRGWRVDRAALDRALFVQAQLAGAKALMQSRLRTAARQGANWAFTLGTPDAVVEGRAKWIIAATGRSARAPLAPEGTRLWLDRLVGIAMQDKRPGPARTEAAAPALVEAGPCGWWYSADLPDGNRLAVFFTDADLPGGKRNLGNFLRAQLSSSPLTHAQCGFLHDRISGREWVGFDARSSVRRMVMSDGWIALGDAAMAFDPLCGRGVTEALSSGIEAAEWLAQSGGPGGMPAWIENAGARFNDFCVQRLRTYAMETRWADSPFWQRRLMSGRIANALPSSA